MELIIYLSIVAVQFGECVLSVESSNLQNAGPFLMTNETKLSNDLLQRYAGFGMHFLPRRNTSTKLTLYVGLRLVHMDIDEKFQTLRTTVWLRLRWTDEMLKWKTQDYDGVDSVWLPSDKIWTPDSLTVSNTYSTSEHIKPVHLKVKNTGLVQWFPLRQFSSECLLDLTDYPYDVHTCTLWVQSLSWPSTHLDLQPYKFNNNNPWDLDTFLESYKLSQPWEIIGNTTERVRTPRNSVILMWSRRVALKYTLTVKRRPGFISYLLRFPVIVLSFMAILIFCLPPERPDRHMFAMSIFACFMILLLILLEKVPPSTASIPKLIYVYCANLGLVIVCISCSVLVIHLSGRGNTGQTPPKCVQKLFFEILAKILLIHRDRLNQVDYKPQERNQNNRAYNGQLIGESEKEVIKVSRQDVETNNRPNFTTDFGMKKITTDNVAKDKGDQTGTAADKQWRLVALILDRLFAFVFLIMNIMIVVLLFPRG